MIKRTLIGGAVLAVVLGAYLFDRGRESAAATAILALVVAFGALEEMMTMAAAKPGRRTVGRVTGAAWLAALVLAGLWATPITTGVADLLVLASGLAAIRMATLIPAGPGSVAFQLSGSLWFQVPYMGGVACLVLPLLGGALEFAVCLVLTAKSSDVGAYFAGKFFGSRPMAPQISPKKTWEGAIGGVALPALVGWWLLGGVMVVPATDVAPAVHFPAGVAAAIIGAVLGVLVIVSDLSESLMKRARNVKDSGHKFGESGGFLDLVDSLLLVGPLAVAYTAIVA